MKHIERYLFMQFLSAVAFSCLAITIVVWFSQGIRMLSMVINSGGSLWSFLSLMVLVLPTFMPLLLPISLAVGIMFVYHRLVTESELVVMRSAGLSPLELSRPALTLAAMFALLGYLLTMFIAPIANHEFVRLQYQIRSDLSVLLLRTGSFNDVSNGLTVYARDRGPKGELRGILIHDTRRADRPSTLMADMGELVHGKDGPQILVRHGLRQEMDQATGLLSQLSFDSYMMDLSSVGDNFRQRWVEPRERNMLELLNPKHEGGVPNIRNRFFSEFHMRLVLPILSVTFTLIVCVVALTGSFDRRGMIQRIVVGALAVGAIEGSVVFLFNLISKQIWMAPLVYIVAFLPIPFLFRHLAANDIRQLPPVAPAKEGAPA
jgi:lipopolysaccharide export system permease protein